MAGVVDGDYRGEVSAVLLNAGHATFEITPGMRIVQLVLEVVKTPPVSETDLTATERGGSGFGSTGTSGAQCAPPYNNDRGEK
jgi:dUTP pyrophosphatase